MVADLILLGRVLTMDPAFPFAQAVAVKGEKIIAVGTRDEVLGFGGDATRIIDAGAASVLPGFIESHAHLVLGGAELAHLQIGGMTGAEIGAAFRDYASQNPTMDLLLAQGADYDLFGHPTTRADLDAIIADRPIAIMTADHHTVWANTPALQAAGLLHGAEMPNGHEVVLDADGLATGELREFEAFAPVIALGGEARLYLAIATGLEPVPWPSEQDQAEDRRKVAAGLAHCAAQGITTIINMDGNRYTLSLLEGLRQHNALTARVRVPFHLKPGMGDEAFARAEAMRAGWHDDQLGCDFVKVFMDGVVDSRTAAMLRDYPGQTGQKAMTLFTEKAFADWAIAFDKRGFQIAVHAIGDAAVRTTLNGFAAARAANGPSDNRHRIEHIEVIDRADIPRLAALDVTASIQPVHAPGAMDFPLDDTLAVLGPAMLPDAFLCRDLWQAGAALAFASDWPVTDVSVLRGIKAALTRPTLAGGSDQRIDLMQVLAAYTTGGARAAHLEGVTGMIKAGLAADITVLSADITRTPPDQIDRLAILQTFANGRETYRSPAR